MQEGDADAIVECDRCKETFTCKVRPMMCAGAYVRAECPSCSRWRTALVLEMLEFKHDRTG